MVKANRVYVSTQDQEEDLPDPVSFELDGTEYICRELGALDLSDLARMNGTTAAPADAVAFMAEFFNNALGDEQYREFKSRAGKFSTRPDVFQKIIEGIFEDLSERNPTKRSDSSGGQGSTGRSSTDGSSSLDDRVLARLEGRPDLQTAVLQARESRLVS